MQRWDDIWQSAHDRAFMVAGAQKADLLNDLRQAVGGYFERGDTIQDFRKNFERIVADRGWTGWTGEGSQAGRAWRTRVIYTTNVASSYAAGRYQQLTDPELLAERPYWRYVHNDSVLHPRPHHQAWGKAGLTLRHDHAFWKTHFPPNGWGCRCRVTAVRGPRAGDATEPPGGWNTTVPKTGAPPGIDKGWAYAPGANTTASLQELIEQKLIKLDAPIGAAMWEALRPVWVEEQTRAFAAFVDATLADVARGKHVVVGALKPRWIDAASAEGVAPASAEIAVRDADVWHTFRSSKTDKLDLAWYKDLPRHLASPDATLLDVTHPGEPAYLLIYGSETEAAKLVVRINYRVKKKGLMNIVETGSVVDTSGIRATIGHGYTIIEGSL
jgi:hypothetical protein